MKRKFLRFIFVSSTVLIGFSSCKETPKQVKPVKIEFKKEGKLTLFKSDSILSKLDIEIAETDYETETGLMHRTEMQDNQAMLFIFPEQNYRSFYMKNTYIPLDIIYINEGKKVVSLQKNAKPLDETSLPSNKLAKYVLEVKAGLSDKWNLAVGDSISFSRQ